MENKKNNAAVNCDESTGRKWHQSESMFIVHSPTGFDGFAIEPESVVLKDI